MPKTFLENPNYSGLPPVVTQQTPTTRAQSGPEQSLGPQLKLKGLGKREQLKKKLAELWIGDDKEATSVAGNIESPNERRHRLRFWRNKKREDSKAEQHHHSWEPANEPTNDSEPFKIRDNLPATATRETTVSSLSETSTVIHSPYAVKCDEDQQSESPFEKRHKDDKLRFARRAAVSASPLLETHESWSRFSPTTVTSSSNAAETFSAVDGSFTPITPMPFTGTSFDAAKLGNAPSAAIASRTIFPPHQDKIRFADVDQQFSPRPCSKSEPATESSSKFKRPLNTGGPLFRVQENKIDTAETSPGPSSSAKIWDHVEEELWIARILKDYCPVRLRKNKRLNFDSEEFRLLQANLTLQTLVDQELRDQDKKLIFRPSLYSGKSFFRGIFHFEQDVDILETMEHFILCNEGLIPLFRGSRPAVRKHLFRRWHNYDRDRIIVCEQLMEKWLEDKTYLTRLVEERGKRQEKRLAMAKNQESDEKLPPMSFFVKKMLIKMSGSRGRIGKPPKRGSKLLVYKKEPLFGVPYFEKKKQQFKGWIKDLMLSI